MIPIAWRGTLVQYAGRLHRIHAGKTDVRVFDYVDGSVPMLAAMFRKRLLGSRTLGYAATEDLPAVHAAPVEPTIELDPDVLGDDRTE